MGSPAFKLDENVPVAALDLFRAAGLDADTVPQEGLAGAKDPAVYRAAQDAIRVLVTIDLDFADIRTYPPAESQGVWILRMSSSAVAPLMEAIQRGIDLLRTENPSGQLWIIEKDRIRVRL